RQGVQGLGGGDVRGGLLPADVLLACLEGEHEAPLALGVAGLPRDPARHLADVALLGADEPERWAAVVEAVAERLALAHAYVHPVLAGRAEDAEWQRVGG